jgi:hypothetical protein
MLFAGISEFLGDSEFRWVNRMMGGFKYIRCISIFHMEDYENQDEQSP